MMAGDQTDIYKYGSRIAHFLQQKAIIKYYKENLYPISS